MTDTFIPATISYDASALPTILSVIAAFLGIAAAVLITALVLIFTVRVKVTLEFKDEIRLWVSFLGIKYRILPEKPKKYKISDYTPEKIAERDRKAAEAAAKKAEAAAKKKAERSAKKRKKKAMETKITAKQKRQQFREKLAKWPAIDDSAELFISIIQTLFTSFLGHFHFHFTRIRIAVGSENAARTALLTTAISSAIKPLLYLIERHSNLHVSRNADICVYPDFLAEDIKFDVKLAFSMSLGSFLWVVIKTAVPGVIGWYKIQPEPPEKEAHITSQSASPSPEKTPDHTTQK